MALELADELDMPLLLGPQVHNVMRMVRSKDGGGENITAVLKVYEAIMGQQIRSFPFNLEVWEFIEEHDLLFIIEQNRDGQMRTLLMAEGGIIPDKLVSILCFDGQPITASFITNKINAHISGIPSVAAS